MEALVTGGEAALGTEGKDTKMQKLLPIAARAVIYAICLPIVWPGVDREVPSGDGWKGCWTLVRMILQSKTKTVSRFLPGASFGDGVWETFVIKISAKVRWPQTPPPPAFLP